MHLTISTDNVTENISILFERNSVEEPVYKAKSAVLDHCVRGKISVQFLFSIPIRKWNYMLSEFFDLELNESDYFLTVNTVLNDQSKIIVKLNGSIKHSFKKLMKIKLTTESSFTHVDNKTAFELHFEMQKCKETETYTLTEYGFQEWSRQVTELLKRITHKVCGILADHLRKPITVLSVTVYPLDKTPPWTLEKVDDEWRISNRNYNFKMDVNVFTKVISLVKP